MRYIKTTFSSGGLDLEACLDLPGNQGRCPGVVLCHPHPLYGGDMNNNVIMAVSRALNQAGIAGLRFNFRGVGMSGGSFDNGVGERQDAGAALDFLAQRDEIDPGLLGIMGYSFGGMVAMEVGGSSEAAIAVAAVSPVIPEGSLRKCLKPKYIVYGSGDSVISSADIVREAGLMPDPKRIEVIPGTDHFWWGCEDIAANGVAGFFAEVFTAGRRQGRHQSTSM